MNPDKILIFYSSKNSKGKRDATGAFIPEAKAFAAHYGVPNKNVIGVDCTKASYMRRKIVLDSIKSVSEIEGLLFLCHGWPTGIQFGFNIDNVAMLASSIRNHSEDIHIALMACSTAENKIKDNEIYNLGPATDGGFADKLRDDLYISGLCGWVDAHKTKGHTTRNPMVVRFEIEDFRTGGEWIVPPHSKLWKHWRTALRYNTDDLRYEFFKLTRAEIEERLLSMTE